MNMMNPSTLPAVYILLSIFNLLAPFGVKYILAESNGDEVKTGLGHKILSKNTQRGNVGIRNKRSLSKIGSNTGSNTGSGGSSQDPDQLIKDGSWTQWGAWSTCNTTCGEGTRQRSRTCSNPEPKYGGRLCAGLETEAELCDKPCTGTHCSNHYECQYNEYCNMGCYLLECDKYKEFGENAQHWFVPIGSTCMCTLTKPKTCDKRIECGIDSGLCLKGCTYERYYDHGKRAYDYMALGDCAEDEYCDEASHQCKSGCIYSSQCDENQYCNMYAHTCQSGNLQCGKLFQTARARIIGGKVVSPKHSQPWMVIVKRCRHCGGTLISSQHILTAGHCVTAGLTIKENARITVTLGDHNCEEYDNGEILAVAKISLHPNYTLESDAADFAILTLTKRVKFSSTIIPACLPTKSFEEYVGHKVTASGWGMMGNGTTPIMDPYEHERNNGTLLTVDLEVLSMSKCKKDLLGYIRDELGNLSIALHETFIMCVGKPIDTNSWKWMGVLGGDSGGPLTVMDPDTGVHTVIGVAFMAPKTSEGYRQSPQMYYSRVDMVLPWIYKEMSKDLPEDVE